jgi:hypothetical protein
MATGLLLVPDATLGSFSRAVVMLSYVLLGSRLRKLGGSVAASFASSVAGIWFTCWSIRFGFDLDYKLDRVGKTVRWVMVGLCLGSVVEAPLLFNPDVRVGVGFCGIAFLVWPNLAYHLTRLLRHWKIVPKADLDQASDLPPDGIT